MASPTLVNFSVSCVMGSDPMTHLRQPASRSLRLAPLDLRYTERPLASKPRRSKMASPTLVNFSVSCVIGSDPLSRSLSAASSLTLRSRFAQSHTL